MIEVIPASREHVKEIFLLTEQFFPYINASEELVLERMESGSVHYLVAVEEGKVAGFVDVELAQETDFRERHKLEVGALPSGRLQAKMLGLAVRKEFQRKGIGAKLLEAGLALARKEKADVVVLLVTEDNVLAQEMYLKRGFVLKGVLERRINGNRVLLYSLALA